jgi:hypothetical protein
MASLAPRFAQKTGFAFGLGVLATSYKMASRFEGNSHRRVDKKTPLIGPSAQLGFDAVAFDRVLLGVRAETASGETLGMGNTDDDRLFEKTNGKITTLNLTGRLGIPLKVFANDPVGNPVPQIWELFFEAGAGRSWIKLQKAYAYRGTPTESYDERIRETQLTAIVAAGLNVSALSGKFFEVKLLRTIPISNEVERSGNAARNGGAVTTLADEKRSDFNFLAMHAIMVSFGKHW